MNTQRSQKKFAFYGRTRKQVPARSAEAIQQRARQLHIAAELANGADGKIVANFFDTTSDPRATWSHRRQARRLLKALADPDRTFDAIVVGDTRITMSAGQFDDLTELRLIHKAELWCPEFGSAYQHGNVHHEEIKWRLFWDDPDELIRPRRQPAGAPLPAGEPPLL